MKQLALTVLSGPVAMALLWLIGMPCGYGLGFGVSIAIVLVVAVALGAVIGKYTDGLVGMLAAACAILTGLMTAFGYSHVRELETGDFVVGVALTDLPHLRGKDRLTLRDGHPRADLGHLSTDREVVGAVGERQTIITHCEAYPIVPDHWTTADPVAVWRIGDPDASLDPWPQHVFHPASPDALCQRAIARAVADHHLHVAADPVYLKHEENESSGVDDNKVQGFGVLAVMSVLWILIALYVAARDAVRDWWRARGR